MSVMHQFIILLLMVHALQANATIQEVFDDAMEVDRKYLEMIEATSEIVNQNTKVSRSNFVATIAVTNEHHIGDKVLMKISTPVSSPFEVHGLARNAIIFAENSSGISIGENLAHIHRRGRIVICATILYSNESEFFEEFTRDAFELWRNRFSQMIFVAWIRDELNIFGIRPYPEKTCFPTELVKIATAKGGKILKTKSLYERIRNLNKCLLRVTTETGMPYAETYVENNVTLVKGIEGNILNVLSERMNFTFRIIDVEKTSAIRARFNDTKDFLRLNESDLYIGAKKININNLEPTVPIMDCKKIWIVPKAKLFPSWMQVIIPFEDC